MNRFIIVGLALFAVLFLVGFLTRDQMIGLVENGLEHVGVKPTAEAEEATE